MAAVIRVSAHYTLRDGVSSKLKTMAAKVTALETALGNAHGKFDKLGESAEKANNPLKDVNTQLTGMKNAIGTKNGTNGLLYRVNNLNDSLGKLAKKDGHNVHIKTTGVKAAERQLDLLEAKAAVLGASKYTIKVDVDKDSTALLRDQAKALDEVKRATEGVKAGFGHLKQGEAELRKTMRAKSQAAEQQRQVMGRVERQFSKVTKEMGYLQRATRAAARDEESFFSFLAKANQEMKLTESFFRKGVKFGMPLPRLFTLIAVGANLAGVALGGLTVMAHGAITPLFLLTKQFLDMGAALGLLPALYGAVGLAVVSTMGAMSAFFGPALKNAQKLSEIQKQLDNVKDAKQRKTLMDQQKQLLGTMTKDQQKLAQQVVDLGSAWRDTFTSNQKLQTAFYATAEKGITTAQALLKRYKGDLQSTANQVRLLADNFFTVVAHNANLQKGIAALFRTSRSLVGSLRKATGPLLDLVGKLLQASEGPLKRVFDAFSKWITQLDSSTGVDKLEGFFQRGLDTAAAWLGILHNLGIAFHNIFAAGADENQGFLQTLQDITAEFANWTGGKGFGLIQREFKAGMKVARALGRFVQQFVLEFMKLGADGEAGKSVSDFIDMLTKGLPGFFDFLDHSLKTIGPSATRFFKSFGGFGETMKALSKSIAFVLDFFADLNNIFDHLPGPVKKLVELFIEWRIISFGLGKGFGIMFGSLGSAVMGVLPKVRMLKGAMAAIKSEGLLGAGANAARSAAGFAPKVATKSLPTVEEALGGGASFAGAGSGAARKGVDVSSRGFNAARGGKLAAGAGTGALDAAGAASFAPPAELAASTAGLAAFGAALAPVLIALGAVVAMFAAWEDNTLGMRTEIEKTWKMLTQNFLTSLDTLVKKLGYVGDATDYLKDSWGILKAEFKVVGAILLWIAEIAIAGVMGALTALVDIISSSIDIIKRPFEELQAFFDLAMSGQTGAAFQSLASAFSDAINMIPDLLRNTLNTAFIDIGNALALAIGGGVNQALDFITHKLNTIITATLGVADKVTGGVAGFENSISNAVGAGSIAAGSNAAGGMLLPEGTASANYQDWLASQQAANGVTLTGPAKKGPLQGPGLPGQPGAPGGAKAKAGASPQASAMAQMAVTGSTAKGLTVNFDQTSLKTFNADVETVKKNLDKLKVGKKFMSRPLNQAFTLGVMAIESGTKRLIAALVQMGAQVNKTTQGFIDTFNTKMSQFGGTPGLGTAPAAAAGAGGSTTPAKHAQGGMVGGDPRRGDVVPILARAGEIVLNPAQQQKLGGRAKIMQSLTGPGTANRPGGFNMAKHAEGGVVANPFHSVESMFGLKRSSGDAEAPGVHAAGGYHYQKAPWGGVRAYDYGDASNSPGALMGAAAWAQQHAGMFSEEFFDKSSQYVKNGSIVKGQFGGHGDHLHLAFALGAQAAAAGAGFGQPPTMGAVPNLGSSRFGAAAQNRLNAAAGVMNAKLSSAFGGSFGTGGLTGGETPAEGSPKAMGQAMAAARGWTGAQWNALDQLFTKESGWNPTARNPKSGAYGIPQALPPTKLPKAGQAGGGSDPGAQIGWGLDYIAGRYTDPLGAMAHETAFNWYGKGGSGEATHPQLIGVGDKRENVQITPNATSAKPGGILPARGGAGGHVVTNNFYIGVMSGDRKALQAFAAEVGAVIAKDLDDSSRSYVQGSRDVMTGNG